MKWESTAVAGAYLLTPERSADERGFFARTYCEREFLEHGIDLRWVQCSVSFNPRPGTLRGLHYQAEPWLEAKLVRCTMGAVFDVIVDLRPGSPTYLRHVGLTLSADDRIGLFIPGGCAHGFQTLQPSSEVFYQMSAFHVPECARGVRWNDPAFGIEWPDADRLISDRDRSYADFPA